MQIVASPREVIVIGAGIVGCAIAYELARRRVSVVVVDDRASGMGATQASAGVLAPFIEARDEGPLLELTARSLDLFDDFIAHLKSDGVSELTYRRSGTLDVALDAESLDALRMRHERLRSRGVEADLLDPAALRQCEPYLSSVAMGGLLIPQHGFVRAAELTCALAFGAERRGAKFVNDGRVTRISRDGAAVRLQTGGANPRTFTADVAVLAAGSWAGTVHVEGVNHMVPVRPVRGQLLHLRWSGHPPPHRILWSERCYIVPWQDGTVLVGATEE